MKGGLRTTKGRHATRWRWAKHVPPRDVTSLERSALATSAVCNRRIVPFRMWWADGSRLPPGVITAKGWSAPEIFSALRFADLQSPQRASPRVHVATCQDPSQALVQRSPGRALVQRELGQASTLAQTWVKPQALVQALVWRTLGRALGPIKAPT